jgi:hypothetical protein
MAEVARACVTRARDLTRTTGHVIDVATPVPARPPRQGADLPVPAQGGLADAFPLYVVALRIDDVEVDIHSARGAGGLPALHVVSFCRHAQGARARRLVSEPGCLVSRPVPAAAPDWPAQGAADYELMSLSAQGGGVPTSLDDLVHRAFTHLVQRWMSQSAPVISSVA